MNLPRIHRVVTGHTEAGKAIVVSNGSLSLVKELASIPGTVFHEVWNTSCTPPAIDNGADPTLGDLVLPPPANGTRIRFVDIPPDTSEFLAHGAASMQAAFSEVGDASASTVKASSPHPLMHRTESIDYGVVIEGEMTLVLDGDEVELKPGSVVVQRGTNHAWANRSGRPCRMLFVLIDAQYAPEITKALNSRAEAGL
jgi:mannose-6-phosphate isomerase-like protein (cupin superfamily)